jgi:ABC-type polar amino acid transport system ATPase subunit
LAPGSSSPRRPQELVAALQRHPTGDEPTSALDPGMIHEVVEVMTDMAKQDVR